MLLFGAFFAMIRSSSGAAANDAPPLLSAANTLGGPKRTTPPPQKNPTTPTKKTTHTTDEATSALDAATEREILDALALLSKGRTSIFVAHRLSTAAQCDQIVVLGPGGKVAESGTHAELLARPGGAYAALWAHQSGGVDELSSAAAARAEGRGADEGAATRAA